MKPLTRNPDPANDEPGKSMRPPPGPPRVEARVAANDEPRSEKRRRTPENPLWIINVGMAAFFIFTALVLMFS